MPMTLPNLDDRRWSDLVDEARAILPLRAPEWTDHNLSDPGITLIELLAWVTEQQLYRIDRVPPAHRLRFLALLGITPSPATGSEAAVAFRLDGSSPLELPAGLLLDATVPTENDTARSPETGFVRFQTADTVTVVPGAIAALHSGSSEATGLQDLSAAWQRGEVIAPFGENPAVNDAFYVSFSTEPPSGVPLSLFVVPADFAQGNDKGALVGPAPLSAPRERQLLREAWWRRTNCGRLPTPGCEDEATDAQPEPLAEAAAAETTSDFPSLEHHSVRLVWEAPIAPGVWRRLDVTAGEVADESRAFTLPGSVILRLPAPPAALLIGDPMAGERPVIRCRIAGGRYDAPPRLATVLLNGVSARQEEPAGVLTLPLAAGAALSGDPPRPGVRERLAAHVEQETGIVRLATGNAVNLEPDDGAVSLLVTAWKAPTPDQAGELAVEAVNLGAATGLPEQFLDLQATAPAGDNLMLWSTEVDPGGDEAGVLPRWRRWQRRFHFGASRRGDSHFLLTPERGSEGAGVPLMRLLLGDGERGRTPAAGASMAAAYNVTSGPAAEVRTDAFIGLAEHPRNKALLAEHLGGAEAVAERIAAINNPLPATGGACAESLDEAAARALAATTETGRVVTLEDLVAVAMETPGTRIARAEARAELHPDFPCYPAPGVLTVLVLPHLPAALPRPTEELLATVRTHVARRRTLGSRIEVVGPSYHRVVVEAMIGADRGVEPDALRGRLIARLDAFFHPLTGGPEGGGWPFGRAVYGSEIYQLLAESEGVDHVTGLTLIGADGFERCSNLCLPPDGLVDSGEHHITIEGGGREC